MQTISIFIPVYNAEAFLEDAIKSILTQTFQDWELLIIDDCSTDKSFDIAERYAANYPGIQVIKNDHNLGMMANWNKGILLSKAPFFVKLDADDIWYPDMLEKSMKIMANYPEVGLIFSRYVNIDVNGSVIQGSDIQLPQFATNQNFSCIPFVRQGPDKMLSYPVLRQGLSIIRREVFEKIGIYRYLITKETQAATDTEFYFRVGAHYDIYCIDEVLYKYRVHANSISATDRQNMLPDQKLYEIKYCIIKYYLEKGLLDISAAKLFLQKVELDFAFTQIAYLRHSSLGIAAIRLLVKTIIKSPLPVMNFYKNRFIQKIRKDE